MSTDTQTAADTKNCAACTYFKPTSESAGECHRRAPHMVAFNVDDNVKFTSRFPETQATDWCGEFAPKA